MNPLGTNWVSVYETECWSELEMGELSVLEKESLSVFSRMN